MGQCDACVWWRCGRPCCAVGLLMQAPCPAGTAGSIMVMTTSGFLQQELRIGENFQEMNTSFLDFELLPEVPRGA